MSTPDIFEGWRGHDVQAAKGNMTWGKFTPKEWQEDDVDIEITHCGVCATDIHVLRSDWGPTPYPCCVGHEIVGKAVRVGRNVTTIHVGDRVGVGPQARSCHQDDCHECSTGNENYCRHSISTYGSIYPNGEGKSYGGFANYNRTNSRFVFKIPADIASEDAAPMLCAGITVYSPLKRYECGSGKKVGIVGIGGLGHFGLLFAKAMGADWVVAISRTSSKRDDAVALGADDFVATEDEKGWDANHARSLDIILLTASSPTMPINGYLSMLRPGGTLVQLGAHEGGEFPRFSALTLLFNGLQIAGTVNGSPTEMREMLDLAAKIKIKPWVQTMPLEQANQALLDLDAGKPRYRLVLVHNNVDES